jgi:hypothetical protein
MVAWYREIEENLNKKKQEKKKGAGGAMAKDIPDQIIVEVDPEIEEEESLVLKRQGTANHSKSLNNESISQQNALIQEDAKSEVNPTSEEELKRELQKWIS